MSENDKARRTISSFMWRFGERCGNQAVTFFVSIILARLLEPSAYGTLALISAFITILQVISEAGMGTALIQKADADDVDFSSCFFLNITVCLGLYGVLFISAPFIAKFYEDTQLTLVIRVMGLSLLISGVAAIQNAYIYRNLLFRKTFFSTIGGTVFSAIIGIYMAYAGFGVWALVAQSLANQIMRMIIIWFTVSWRPKLAFSFKRVKFLFSYGWRILASNLLDSVYNELRQLIIGKMYSSSDLAFYNRGKHLPNLVTNNINGAIDSVLFPEMSKEQNDKVRLKNMTRRAIRTSSYIMAPMMVGVTACAEPLIRLLLTEKWLSAAFFMRIFCITYMFYPVHTANLNAIKAMGRSDWFLKLEIVKKVVGIALVVATMFISVEAMAYSLLVSTLLSTMINAYPNKKLLDYSWAEQMKDILPHIALAVAMGVPVYLLQFLSVPTILVLILQVITGAAIYVSLSVCFKLEIFTYLLNILKGFRKR